MTKAISNIIINEIEKVGNYIGNKMESVSSRLDKTRGELMQEIYKIKRDLERLKQNKSPQNKIHSVQIHCKLTNVSLNRHNSKLEKIKLI